MTVKERVLEVITRMPDDSTLDDIGYELYVIESVQKGLDELDRGDYLTHEQAKRDERLAAVRDLEAMSLPVADLE